MAQKQKITQSTQRKPAQQAVKFHVLLAVFAVVGIAGAGASVALPRGDGTPRTAPMVLAYATEMGRGELLAYTNQNRAASGLTGLGLNAQLNNAAQAKAQDMVAKDYWAHTSPSGEEPWDFINRAGYRYTTAGENLAYGVQTSSATVQAWMNSPGHRANILNGNFTEVGFGFVNAQNYQSSGNQTVVVAMYARPVAQAPTPAPAPAPTPAPAPAPAPAPTPPTAPAPAATTSPAPAQNTPQASANQQQAAESSPAEAAPQQEQLPVDNDEQPTQIASDGSKTIAAPEDSKQIHLVQQLTGNYSGVIVGVLVTLGLAGVGVFLYLHSKAWHRWIVRGEQFILHHPLIDIAIAAGLIGLIVLLQVVGRTL